MKEALNILLPTIYTDKTTADVYIAILSQIKKMSWLSNWKWWTSATISNAIVNWIISSETVKLLKEYWAYEKDIVLIIKWEIDIVLWN